MAQAMYGYAQPTLNRGTLHPGQSIQVNQHTVQVEKYLSQGGFAHVYVVRTANPISNAIQHVLKRIAVADRTMLAGVQKEVDVMRKLRGHPNIVNFIDAAWHTLPNGTYEVFILMEFCPGGGIIDMMNRRIRERLTESEILQIFVDVCEAVAHMHNLNAPLLHRDLKIENILQTSNTLYKLCDFGSAIPVSSRPPSSIQEIRALEADLNRHTTLQYRAPEMVDVHLRRPIDEKSDIWALGVLLYKLCYYTTPFEEHGPLAILNVQYRIPPYPVYSIHMNALIGSMLRELGTQRPSVFEILDTVHHLRGTRSLFTYKPRAAPAMRLRSQELSPTTLDSIVSIRPSSTPSSTAPTRPAHPSTLESVAPMRRGRPAVAQASTSPAPPPPPPHPDMEKEAKQKFEAQWNAAKNNDTNQKVDDAWTLPSEKLRNKPASAFNGFGDSFGESFDSKSSDALIPSPSPIPSKKPSDANGTNQKNPKDAFDGIGGISWARGPAPTLAEVANNTRLGIPSPGSRPQLNGISRSPGPTPVTPLSPRIPASRTGLATYRPSASLSAEERFPSLDELDKSWKLPKVGQQQQPAQTPPRNYLHSNMPFITGTSPQLIPSNLPPLPAKPVHRPSLGEMTSLDKSATKPDETRSSISNSENVLYEPSFPPLTDKRHIPIGSSPTKYRPSRPALARKHRSSVNIKAEDGAQSSQDWLTGDDAMTVIKPIDPSRSPLRRRPSSSIAPKIPSSTSASHVPTVSASPSKPPIPTTAETIQNAGPTESANLKTSVFKHPLPSERSQVRVPASQDSSSEEGEGPEDVNTRIVGNREVHRPKGRQSSVHGLVDLYGGASRASASRDQTDVSSPSPEKKERRTSGILVDVSLPAAPSITRPASTLLSPNSIIPESRAELAGRASAFGSRADGVPSSSSPSPPSWTETRQPSSRPSPSPPPSRTSPIRSSSGLRLSPVSNQREPSPGRPPSLTPPISSSSSSTDHFERPRPQSMFMIPPSSSSNVLKSPGTTEVFGLNPPVEEPRQSRAMRRGSISDMVTLYENLSGASNSNFVKRGKEPPPLVAQKPTGLVSGKQTPSPVLSRFPPISPTGVSFIPSPLILPPPTPSEPQRSPKHFSHNPPPATSRVSLTDSNLVAAAAESSSEATSSSGKSRSGERMSQFLSRLPRRTSVSPSKRTPVAAVNPGTKAEPLKTVVATGSHPPVKPVKPTALSVHAQASSMSFNPVRSSSPLNMPSARSDNERGATEKGVTITSSATDHPPSTPNLPSPTSPDRPFQGVSKLIDQWQRKTEEANRGGAMSQRVGRPMGPRAAVPKRVSGDGKN